MRVLCTVGGDGDDEDVANAGDDELDEETDGTRWMTEIRTTEDSGAGSSDFFCVDKLMSCGSGRMLAGSLTMIASSLGGFGVGSLELEIVGGVGGYSLRCACVKMNLWDPLPYGISPPKSDDLKRLGGSAASI